MYPEREVVVDDRHDLYGSDRIRQYLILTQAEPDGRTCSKSGRFGRRLCLLGPLWPTCSANSRRIGG